MAEVLKDVKAAFALARITSKKVHHKVVPQFKKKTDRLQTFSYYRTVATTFHPDGDYTFSINTKRGQPRCVFRTSESVAWMKNDNVKLCRLTISKRSGKYWMTVSYEKPNQEITKPNANSKIGIDLGIVKSAVTHDGNKTQEVSFNTKRSMHLDRLSKRNDDKLSRMVYGSNRYEKALLLKEKRADRAAQIRKAAVEEYTTFLARNYQDIVIDDFSFKGALKVANPNKAYRSMVYQFKDRLEQKAKLYGNVIRYVDHKAGIRTSRKCSCCGSENVKIDAKRIVHCLDCGASIDRDENAAINCYSL